MEVITSHSNTDLDGLASMVAAKKLYPEAEMVFAGKLCRNVQEFMSLHKDRLNIRVAKEIPLEHIKKLILVDTKTPNRLGPLKSVALSEDVEIHIYDHHPRSPEDISGKVEIIELVGAATTLFVEIIRDKSIALSPFEATILALGIYEDTGCLTFSTTTARDAQAIAYLLSHGAKLSIVADFIGRPLTEEQKNLLNTLIISSQHYLIHGVKVLITKASIDEFVGGLALLTHKLGDIENLDAIFAIVQMEDRVHIVARSRSDLVNVNEILDFFGGGGHEKAASATVKDGNIDILEKELHNILQHEIKPMTVAAQLMSAPVKTVPKDTTIEEAGKIMLRYGHTGLPVLDGENIVGIISRRDLDKANHHGLGHAPVKAYMSTKVKTISGKTTLQEIQDLMINHNIGRLPVVDEGRLVGIVSRTDVLRTIHGENYKDTYQTIYSAPQGGMVDEQKFIVDKMTQLLPQDIRELLAKVSYLADRLETNVYVVGGFVRDLLLEVENLDIDLVVEGDGIKFAMELAEFLCGRVRTHHKFGTAVVILDNGFKIDVATARIEFYEFPAALPRVETSSIRQDLYRRDFTINAMAITLSQKNFGEIIDYFSARRDLENGIVRVLYNLSFVEDPTRILRAIRFEQRYNFNIDGQTLELAKQALKDKMLTKVSFDRVREELKNILSEADPHKAISRMEELDLWKYIIPEISFNQGIYQMLTKLPDTIDVIKARVHKPFAWWLVFFIGITHQLSVEDAQEVCNRLRMTKEETVIIISFMENWQEAESILNSAESLKVSQLTKVLKNVPVEGYPFLLTISNVNGQKKLVRYLEKIQELKITINGDDLINLGIAPSPRIKEILNSVKEAKLDGLIVSHEEELDFAKRLMNIKEAKK